MPPPTACFERYHSRNQLDLKGLLKIKLRRWAEDRHLDLDDELDATGFRHNPSPNPPAGSDVVVVDLKRVVIRTEHLLRPYGASLAARSPHPTTSSQEGIND